MREIGISPRFSRDKFVPLQTKQRYSTRDISGEVFLTLFFRGFVPFLSLADFVSRDKNLQVADLQRLKLYFGGLVTATTSNHQYDVDAVKAIHSALRQNLSITFLPTDQWHIAFGAEHYFMRFSTDQTASITFLDASVRWLLSKRIDLALAATNLLDETDYRYTSFGSLSESLYSFSIRPRNIIIRMQVKI